MEVYPELVIPHSAQALLWLWSSCHLFRVQVKVPVCVFAFDCLYVDGQSLLKRPLQERRERLAAALPGLRPGFVCLAQSHVLQSPAAPAPTPESAQPAAQPPRDLSEQPVVRGGSPDASPCAVVPPATPDRLAARPTPDRADDSGAMEVDVPGRDDVMDDVTELGAAAVGAHSDSEGFLACMMGWTGMLISISVTGAVLGLAAAHGHCCKGTWTVTSGRWLCLFSGRVGCGCWGRARAECGGGRHGGADPGAPSGRAGGRHGGPHAQGTHRQIRHLPALQAQQLLAQDQAVSLTQSTTPCCSLFAAQTSISPLYFFL